MRTLLLVDIQRDFLPGGSLAVTGGDEVVPVANRLMTSYDRVLATQDWHPADHKSFASQHPGGQVGQTVEWQGLTQILWPDHCVQGTPGAELADGLNTGAIERVFQKGVDRDIDSYSGFFDNGRRRATGLGDHLTQLGTREVHVVGLALDVCVKFTALDGRRLGFDVTVQLEGCRGVELQQGDCDRAIHEMRDAGVTVR